MEKITFDLSSLQEKQRLALKKSFTTPVLFYGGAKGGGKSYLIRARELVRRLKYPGSVGLIVRKTFPELLSNHIRKFFQEYPITRQWYNKQEKTIYYPNGSVTEFSYLRNTDDVYNYQGRDFDDMGVDEVTQHEWEVIRVLRSSLRKNPKLIDQGFKPTILLTGNPGGIGHADVKRLFIDRDFREGENPKDFDFIQAFVSDNKALMEADPEYIKRLEDLPEHLRKAYLEGDWNIFAGQAFAELHRSVHLIDPIELPPGSRYFASFDPGYVHPFSFVVYAIVPDGSIYVVQEYSDKGKTTHEIANGIRALIGSKKLNIYSGHDLWYPGRGGGASQVEEFIEQGLGPRQGFHWIKAKTDRKSGVTQIHKFINPKNYPDNKPRLFFFKNTIEVFDAVASMQINPKDPEDVLKVDADADGFGGDDRYDSFRYGVMSRVFPDGPEEEIPGKFSGQAVLNDLMEDEDGY